MAGGMLLGMVLVVAAVFGLRMLQEANDKNTVADKSHTYVFKARNLNNIEEKAFKLVLPEKGWASDNTIRQRLGAVTAWRSADQDAWFAVAARDYGQTKPRDAELVRRGIERLEQYFEGGLELAEKPEPAKWSDVEGQRLLFKGQLNAVTWRGYVYMLTHQGFGYWLYVAAPSEDEAQALYASTVDAGTNGFFPDTARKGWREQPPKMKDYTTENQALTISLIEGVFEKHQAKDQDERAQLYLFAKYQREKDNRKNADILVLMLDKQGDLKESLEAARKYLEDRKREESQEYKVEFSGAVSASASDSVGNRPGRIVEGKLLRGETPIRFWIVAVVLEADKLYVIRCDCHWDHRQIWREEFLQALQGMKFKD